MFTSPVRPGTTACTRGSSPPTRRPPVTSSPQDHYYNVVLSSDFTRDLYLGQSLKADASLAVRGGSVTYATEEEVLEAGASCYFEWTGGSFRADTGEGPGTVLLDDGA